MPRRLVKNDPDEVRERLMRRERWPVALLAEMLGCSPKAVYGRVKRGEWSLEDGCVPTEQVMEGLEEFAL